MRAGREGESPEGGICDERGNWDELGTYIHIYIKK